MGLLWIAMGLGVGVGAPRHRFATLLSCVGLLTVLVALRLMMGTLAPAMVVGPVLALAPAAMVLLARRWPRPFMPMVLAPTLALCAMTLPALPGLATPAGLGLAALGLGLVVLATLRMDWGVHLLCAALGARLLLQGLPWSHPWLWPGAAALLLLAGWLACRGVRGTAPGATWVRRALTGWAVAILLLIVALPYAARPLPAPIDAVHAARLARLKKQLPSGGLVWPLPDLENPDARYLSGKPAGLVRLPESSPVWGAFWSNDPIARMRRPSGP